MVYGITVSASWALNTNHYTFQSLCLYFRQKHLHFVHVLQSFLKGHQLKTIHYFTQKMSKANGESCPISRMTVQVVEECPDSLEKWNRAAERKNCAAFATHCGGPKKLQYHCVINPFVNATIEVCAYAQNIVLGKKLWIQWRFIIWKTLLLIYFKRQTELLIICILRISSLTSFIHFFLFNYIYCNCNVLKDDLL